ncbi:MAG: flagellar export protein FliJ [Parvibaculaceae bacterium]
MRSKESALRLQRFRHDEKQRQVSDIEMMIAEFQRKQEELDNQVKAEETRSGVSDPGHFNYSLTAKAIRTRRDNLVKSIDDLREQLAGARSELDEVTSELQKAELLLEKSTQGSGMQMAAFNPAMSARS